MALSLGLKAKSKYLGFMAVGQGLRAIGLFEQQWPGFLGPQAKRGLCPVGHGLKPPDKVTLQDCFSVTVLRYYSITPLGMKQGKLTTCRTILLQSNGFSCPPDDFPIIFLSQFAKKTFISEHCVPKIMWRISV